MRLFQFSFIRGIFILAYQSVTAEEKKFNDSVLTGLSLYA
jgi:hypothetical protein